MSSARHAKRAAGFPEVYGLGHLGSSPLVVMEWVKGPTLAEAALQFSAIHRKTLGNAESFTRRIVPTEVACAVLRDTAHVLLATKCLKKTFLHRDLSPRNILIRTSQRSLAQQVVDNSFDVVLVDLGSSRLSLGNKPTLTDTHGVWRYGTAEYAAPEMLSNRLPNIAELRGSEAVDTYALCSILYWLLTDTLPFEVTGLSKEEACSIKMQKAPHTLSAQLSRPERELMDIALSGIRPRQEDRPSLQELAEHLDKLADALQKREA